VHSATPGFRRQPRSKTPLGLAEPNVKRITGQRLHDADRIGAAGLEGLIGDQTAEPSKGAINPEVNIGVLVCLSGDVFHTLLFHTRPPSAEHAPEGPTRQTGLSLLGKIYVDKHRVSAVED
jgi:hypothetical protein